MGGNLPSVGSILGNKAVKFHQSIMASGLQIPGTRGRVSVILLFVNLMTMSSEGHGTTVQSYQTVTGCWMRGSLTLICHETIKEASGTKFRAEPFEKSKFMIFTCDCYFVHHTTSWK
ncbi:hypothetical protein Bca52824_088805 [Brassica carinata]|uniref:Uncharacterized protein n=1 Tax=Brassica carinata TaxID=52824 RepID=A0A8X7PEC1_BRACI|nr:hypothetical protein Bca52824_088805 [Brassica carinata]